MAKCERPDERRYEWIELPECDVWGAVVPTHHPLAKKGSVTAVDLAGVPLFVSEQGWAGDITTWAGETREDLRLEGTCRLSYNASLFAREGMGALLTFDGIVDTSPGSGLVFRPLEPRLEARLYLVWGKRQLLTPIARRFAEQVRESFGG